MNLKMGQKKQHIKDWVVFCVDGKNLFCTFYILSVAGFTRLTTLLPTIYFKFNIIRMRSLRAHNIHNFHVKSDTCIYGHDRVYVLGGVK